MNIIIVVNNQENTKSIIERINNTKFKIKKTFVVYDFNDIENIINNEKEGLIIINQKVKLCENKNFNFDNYSICKYNLLSSKDSMNLNCQSISNNNEYLVVKKVINEMNVIGYNFKYKGTQYLLECITYIINQNNMDLLDNLNKNVYEYVATKYNKSLSNIKTNIIKATEYVNIYQDKDILLNYFSISIDITPKFVISTILNKLLF